MPDNIGTISPDEVSQLWSDAEATFTSGKPLRDKYESLYRLLRTVCTQLTAPLLADYSDFFSRLQAVCRLTNYPLYDVDVFRWRARMVAMREIEPTQEMFLVDTKAFADALAHFTSSAIPVTLRQSLPDRVPHSKVSIAKNIRSKRRRFVFDTKDDNYIYALSGDIPDADRVRICYDTNDETRDAAAMLEDGMNFNAVSYTIDADGVVHPDLIIVDPDCLVDITAIAGCIKPYGDDPLNYTIDKFKPALNTVHTLLGMAANQFLDDCVNSDDADYVTSLKKVYKDNVLAFTACTDIGRDFFDKCRQQFDNIKKSLDLLTSKEGLIGNKDSIYLEPSFFCETLGIQGRMDFLQDDCKALIELKSGKWDEYRRCGQAPHVLQMILYKEILYYNLGVRQKDVRGFLFYSKYPHIQEQRSAMQMVERAMAMRNGIIRNERLTRQGGARQLISSIDTDSLRTSPGCSQKLWGNFCRPDIESVMSPIREMDVLTADYFYTFLEFVERERYMAKAGDSRVDSTRGMASLWNADLDAKLDNGDILTDLTICEIRRDDGVEALRLRYADSGAARMTPNFREGDAVVLYQRTASTDSVTNRQVVRCAVERYTDDGLWLRLRFKQRNEKMFSGDTLFAIEHDTIESGFKSLYSGLHAFLRVGTHRRDLLLCRTKPEADKSLTLDGKYLNSQIDDIVTRAKQARDYFLLVGPPGTGKTSVALRSMVEELTHSGEDLLLLSYTNRAVDEMCAMLATISPEPHYIRLGRTISAAPAYHPHLLERMTGDNMRRDDIRKWLGDTHIFVSTVASLCAHMELLVLKHFNTAIIDEASQILEPQILGILCDTQSPGSDSGCSIDKFIMIGDHKQLPAVVVQDDRRSATHSEALAGIGLTNCRDSLFERLYRMNASDSQTVALLDRQGRMHADISEFASSMFYEGQLKPVPLKHQEGELHLTAFAPEEREMASNRFIFIDTPLPDPSERIPKANIAEARAIAATISGLATLYAKNGMTLDTARDIGVIVPYRKQIAAVRGELAKAGVDGWADIMIDTVERYQGSQRDIIIYGTTITRTYELETLSNITDACGIMVDRKLNVAVTRARKQMFILGNRTLLSLNPVYKRLIDYCDTQHRAHS